MTGASSSAAPPPEIALPEGFEPVAAYGTPVRAYDFGGGALPEDWSPGIWNYGYRATQYRPSQVAMTGGSVALTAARRTSPQGYPYTSGWIDTEGRFALTHGLIQFRARMPSGRGLWSGLWAVGARGSTPLGEIDVQEMLLGDTRTVYGSLHGWDPPPPWARTASTALAADASQGFHDYQAVWQPGMITWAVDGVAYAQSTRAEAVADGRPWPFDTQTGTYLVANLAVAASDEWGGAPDASTTFPAVMELRSVTVWQ